MTDNLHIILLALLCLAFSAFLIKCNMDRPYTDYLRCTKVQDAQKCFELTIKDKEVYR